MLADHKPSSPSTSHHGEYVKLTRLLHKLDHLSCPNLAERENFWSVAIENYLSDVCRDDDRFHRRLALVRLVDQLELDGLLSPEYLKGKRISAMESGGSGGRGQTPKERNLNWQRSAPSSYVSCPSPLKPYKKINCIPFLITFWIIMNLFFLSRLMYDKSSLTQIDLDPFRRPMPAQQRTPLGTDNEMIKKRQTPVVFIPGSMGSLLEAKLDKKKVVSNICYSKADWATLWITESALIASECFFDNIKMRYLGNGKVDNNEGVETRVPFYGDSVEGIRCILRNAQKQCRATGNWFQIIDEFEAVGYQVGKDLFSAPFDFRRGPDDFMEDDYPRLKALVERAYQSNGQLPVALVSLSLGSMLMHTFFTHFVDQAWKDKHVDRWLTMSGVFNGLSMSFLNTVFGRNQVLGLQALPQTQVRDAYRSWQSSAWLIPKPIYGDDRVILETPSRSYTLSEIDEVLFGDQADMYRRSFMYNMTADPGVPTDCWFSKRKRTPLGYRIKQEMTKELFYSMEGVEAEDAKFGSGDGGGDLKSLEICERWPSTTVRHLNICHGCFLYRGPARQILMLLGALKTQETEATRM